MKEYENWTLRQKVGALFSHGFAGVIYHQTAQDKITRFNASGIRVSPLFKQWLGYRDPKTGELLNSTCAAADIDLDSQPYVRYRPDQAPILITRAKDYQNLLRRLYDENEKKGLGLPLHFCFDQEGSESADFCYSGAPRFPQPMGLAAAGSPDLSYEVAYALGRMMRAIGLTWIHSPVLDINSEPRNPEVLTRAYGTDAETVAEYAIAACRGFKESGVITTGKHFPGRGHSTLDAHFDVPVIDADEDTLWERELLPYQRLIEEDLMPTVMIAHSVYPAIDPDDVATASRKVVTGLLREKMGFKGVITTDSITMGGMMKRYGLEESCVRALEAGCDLVLQKMEEPASELESCLDAVVEAVENGRIPLQEVHEKLERQFKLKRDYKLDRACRT